MKKGNEYWGTPKLMGIGLFAILAAVLVLSVLGFLMDPAFDAFIGENHAPMWAVGAMTILVAAFVGVVTYCAGTVVEEFLVAHSVRKLMRTPDKEAPSDG